MSKTKHTDLLRNSCAALEQRLGPIEYRPIDAARAYEGHPRKHPEKQIVQLMASIRQFGFAMPALVDGDGVLIVGHGRVEAARRLGMAEIPVLVAGHWSKAQVDAYRLADNQLARHATWDDNLLRIEIASIIQLDEMPIEILGWETGEIDLLLEGTIETEDTDAADDVPDLPDEPVARSGDLWLLGRHRLLCGSSLEPENWTRLMDGATAAMVLTDAPFNVPVNGHVSGSGRHAEFAMASGEMSEAEFIAFNQTYLTNMAAHLKDGAIVTRSGRFDASFFVDVPSDAARHAIWSRSVAADLDGEDAIDTLVAATSMFSGADIHSVVKLARARAVYHGEPLRLDGLTEEIARKRPRVEALYAEFGRLREWAVLNAEPASATS